MSFRQLQRQIPIEHLHIMKIFSDSFGAVVNMSLWHDNGHRSRRKRCGLANCAALRAIGPNRSSTSTYWRQTTVDRTACLSSNSCTERVRLHIAKAILRSPSSILPGSMAAKPSLRNSFLLPSQKNIRPGSNTTPSGTKLVASTSLSNPSGPCSQKDDPALQQPVRNIGRCFAIPLPIAPRRRAISRESWRRCAS